MATKTITVTENAYEALKSIKEQNESFSETILRVSNKRQLDNFFGVFDKANGERFENTILKLRKKRNESHKLRLKKIVTKDSHYTRIQGLMVLKY